MKKLYMIIALCLLPFMVGAQGLKTSYFSEYSSLRNKLNPAFMPRSNYVGFAALDNLGVGVNSNIGMSTFLYPGADGKLLTFMHPDVSSETFLNRLPANPFLDLDIDTDILNIGFYSGKNSFWTVSLGVKVDLEANIPHELFRFLKVGAETTRQEYHIKDFNITQNAFVELALGYTHNFQNLVPGLRFGGKLKFLVGADRADIRANNIDLTMGADEWNVKTDATADLMLKGMDLSIQDQKFGITPIGGYGPAGYGAGLDLGIEYRLKVNDFFDSIRFSAAMTDLGFISYPAASIQHFKSAGEFTYSGIQDIDPSDPDGLKGETDKIMDDLMGLANLEETTVSEGSVQRLKPQVFVGVEMPFLWNKMSFGLLYNTKFGYTKNRNELTMALSARPVKAFNATVSYSMLNSVKTIGWLLEFIPRGGINMFLGSDYTFFNVAPQYYIPVDELNFNIRMGFSVAFGSKHHPKKTK